MGKIEDKIPVDLKTAMLAKDKVKLAALRAVKSAFLLEKTKEGFSGNISDDQAQQIISKLHKQRMDALAIYKEQNREDLAHTPSIGGNDINSSEEPQSEDQNQLLKIVKDITSKGFVRNNYKKNLVDLSDVKISLRVSKEYKDFVATGRNDGKPMYSWDMADIATQTGSQDQLVNVLDLINVVPNPYKAYSEYERNRIDSRVKITNLPERCTIKIYSVNGKLIKTFKKDNPSTYQDWLLVNHKGIAVSSGVYLIHVEVPGIGDRIIKSFVAMRQVDLNGT